MINRERLIKLTQNLVRINSENPPGNEIEIARFVQGYLKRLGVATKVYEFSKNRPNIVGILKTPGAAQSLLITPHLDTVPAGGHWRKKPFAAAIIGTKLYGVGATDCKCNIACALEAMESLIEDKRRLAVDLIFAATADEESGSSLGLIPLLDKGILKPDAALVLDADDFDIIVAQKGLMHLTVKLQGKRAHGAYPWRGVNAIDAASYVLQGLHGRRRKYRPNKYLRLPTVNVGTIKGGDKVNIVADWCEFELDFRFLPGTNAQDLLRDLRAIVKQHAKHFTIDVQGVQQPYEIKESHPLVSALKQAMRSVNLQPRIKGSEGATVITFFQNKGIPATATGFGSGGMAHAVDEYVEVEDLYKGTRVLESFLTRYNPCAASVFAH